MGLSSAVSVAEEKVASPSQVFLTLYPTPPTLLQESTGVMMGKFNQGFGFGVLEQTVTQACAPSQSLTISPLPLSVDPNSISLIAIAPKDLRVTSVSYVPSTYTNLASILIDHLGKTVTITVDDKKITGTLLAISPSVLLKTTEGMLHHIATTEHLTFSDIAIPPTVTTPHLNVQLALEKPTQCQFTLLYQLSHVGWSASYQLWLEDDSDTPKARIEGHATLTNQTNQDFSSATLQLIAGEPNRTQGGPRIQYMRANAPMMAKDTAESVTEQAMGDYYLYTLPGTTSLPAHSHIRIPLGEYALSEAKKRYRFQGHHGQVTTLLSWHYEGEKRMPAGEIQVYKRSAGKTQQWHWLGEDRLPNTTTKQDLSITLGQAFDVSGKRIVETSKQQQDGHGSETIAITLTNQSARDITVEVEEALYRDGWNITEKTHEYQKIDAHTVRFAIPVAKGKSTVLRYSVRY